MILRLKVDPVVVLIFYNSSFKFSKNYKKVMAKVVWRDVERDDRGLWPVGRFVRDKVLLSGGHFPRPSGECSLLPSRCMVRATRNQALLPPLLDILQADAHLFHMMQFFFALTVSGCIRT